MKSSAKKIELASVDDLFSTEESRQDEQLEKIQEIPLSELHPFKDHPFKVMTYIQNGDYLIPDLKLSQQPEKPLGKYGRMRKTYLKEHRPILYNQMLLSEKLYQHLLEIDETAQNRLEQMMPQLAKEAGATEELKASDPMKWVGLMNTCKAQAEEILMAELINS